jgi:hypothetical protein
MDPDPVVVVGSSLYAKLVEVMKAVGYVPKRGRNEFHKYDYVTEADLVEAVRNELSSRGIVMLAQATDITREGTLTTVHMEFLFVDPESGEQHQAKWIGTGEDKGDKGLYKAYTGAIKYFLMKSFLIPTGDDPERDDGKAAKQNGKPETVTAAWAADARKRITDFGIDHGEARMKLTSLNAAKLEELSPADAAKFDAWLSEKAEVAVDA